MISYDSGMGRISARENLLDTAENLFGLHGIEGISLRKINTEAGLSPAALHYHFGSKPQLIEALLERHMPALMERRRGLLDQLSDQTEPVTTRAVLRALMQPLVELLSGPDTSGHRYLRLIHRLQADRDLDPQYVIDRWPSGVDRLLPLLRLANPEVSLPVLQFRLSLSIEVMLKSLAQDTPPLRGGLNAHASALLDFLTAGFEGSAAGDF
jgi:AcrR family transcriptional regulator